MLLRGICGPRRRATGPACTVHRRERRADAINMAAKKRATRSQLWRLHTRVVSGQPAFG